MAARYTRGEAAGHSLPATALALKVFLRLVDVDSVTWQDRAHFIARLGRRHTRADLLHSTRHIQPQDCGQRLLRMAALTGTDLGVQWIDSAGADPDEYLAAPRLRRRRFYLDELSVRYLNNIRLHGPSPASNSFSTPERDHVPADDEVNWPPDISHL